MAQFCIVLEVKLKKYNGELYKIEAVFISDFLI